MSNEIEQVDERDTEIAALKADIDAGKAALKKYIGVLNIITQQRDGAIKDLNAANQVIRKMVSQAARK